MLRVGFLHVESSCVLTLCGELTGSSIPALEAQIDQIGCAACEHVALDLSGLVAIDSVGVHVLVGLDAYVHGLGARLTMSGARGAVAEALALTSLKLVESVRTHAPRRPPLFESAVLLDESTPL
jgi:anti-anti-sigma factor